MYRMSIREWLLATLTVGLALGWFLDHRRIAAILQERDEWRNSLHSLVEDLSDQGVIIRIEGHSYVIGGYSGPMKYNWDRDL